MGNVVKITIKDETVGKVGKLTLNDSPLTGDQIYNVIIFKVKEAERIREVNTSFISGDEDEDEFDHHPDEDEVVGYIPLDEYGSKVERQRRELREQLDDMTDDDWRELGYED